MRAVSDVAQLHGCRLLAVMPSEMVAGLEPKIVWEGESPLVQLSEFHLQSWQRAAKRALDRKAVVDPRLHRLRQRLIGEIAAMVLDRGAAAGKRHQPQRCTHPSQSYQNAHSTTPIAGIRAAAIASRARTRVTAKSLRPPRPTSQSRWVGTI